MMHLQLINPKMLGLFDSKINLMKIKQDLLNSSKKMIQIKMLGLFNLMIKLSMILFKS